MRALYDHVSLTDSLAGSRAHERFLKQGFHYAADSFEIRRELIAALERGSGQKTYVFFTTGSLRPDLVDTAWHAILYFELVKTIFGEFRDGRGARTEITFLFEGNESLDRSFSQIVESARDAAGSKATVLVESRAKMDPHSIAISDYAMPLFGEWWESGETSDPNKCQFRNWKTIRSSVSVVLELETGALYRRGQPTRDAERGAERRRTKPDGVCGRDSCPEDVVPPSPWPSLSPAADNSVGLKSMLARAHLSREAWDRAVLAVEDGTGYRWLQVPKRRRGTRQVAAPTVEVMSVQKQARQALEGLLQYTAMPNVHGYVPGRNARTNAAEHLQRGAILTVDLKNFFGSISGHRIEESLRKNGATKNLARQVVRLATINDRLAAGFSMSPFLSNLVFEATDVALARYAADKGISYSRYADDLSFSGDVGDDTLVEICDLLDKRGWVLNPRKTRFLRRGRASM